MSFKDIALRVRDLVVKLCINIKNLVTCQSSCTATCFSNNTTTTNNTTTPIQPQRKLERSTSI